jgi:hypothetical protein
MIAAPAMAPAMHGPAAEAIEIDMVGSKADGTFEKFEDPINFVAHGDHVAVEIAVAVCPLGDVAKQVGLEENARLMVVEPVRQVDLDDVGIGGRARRTRLHEQDLGAGKLSQITDGDRTGGNMSLADDSEYVRVPA